MEQLVRKMKNQVPVHLQIIIIFFLNAALQTYRRQLTLIPDHRNTRAQLSGVSSQSCRRAGVVVVCDMRVEEMLVNIMSPCPVYCFLSVMHEII